MLAKWEHITEDEILDANINKYNDDNIVNFYADFEEPRYSYHEYEVIIQALINALHSSLGHNVRAVDICGGTGKAAFVVKKCNSCCQVTLVDVSRKMLDIARLKAKRLGVKELNIVQADAFGFLAREEEYDLIIFSSAIHHFKDPCKLLCAAAQRLSPEGMIVTIADPTILIRSKRYKMFEFVFINFAGKKKILQDLFFKSKKNDSDDPQWDIAEYQALKGIDDKSLARQLYALGLQPLVHMRYPAGEPYMTKIMPLIGLNWAFSLILRRSDHDKNHELARELKKQFKAGLRFKFQLL